MLWEERRGRVGRRSELGFLRGDVRTAASFCGVIASVVGLWDFSDRGWLHMC